MNIALSFLAGAVVGLVVLKALLPSLQRAPFLVDNFRKDKIPTAAGLVLVVTVVTVEAGRAALAQLRDQPMTPGTSLAVVAAVGAFAAFGLLDDLAALPGDRGFKGHLRALARGRLTTGSLKLFGGSFVALAVVGTITDRGIGWLLVDGAIVALSANLTNLFDLRPGRTLKVSFLWGALLLACSSFDADVAPVATVLGAGLALFVPDLRARLMLGDTGSNVLGAALGLGVVIEGSSAVRIAFAIGLVVLTVLGDVIGFTRIIRATPPLRYLDELGRPTS